jgi:hypothetical protein
MITDTCEGGFQDHEYRDCLKVRPNAAILDHSVITGV